MWVVVVVCRGGFVFGFWFIIIIGEFIMYYLYYYFFVFGVLFVLCMVQVVVVVLVLYVFGCGLVVVQDVGVGLKEVVVIVIGFEQEVVDVLVSIIVIGQEELKKCFFCDFIDVLCDVEGVIIIGMVSEKDIFICGLFGVYMFILVDGKCQSMCDVWINGNFGFEQFYILLLEVIECIEVVCGLMFLLYGFDVMGGVINIIIKKVVW